MPSSGFRFIQEYKNMARDLVEEPDYLLCDFDQQVPQSRFMMQATDMKPQIKLEDIEGQEDPFFKFMTDSIISNDSSSSSNSTDHGPTKIQGSHHYYTSSNYKVNHNSLNNQFVSNNAMITSSPTPTFFTSSSSSSQHMTSASHTPTFAPATKPTLAPRNSTVISEIESNCNSYVPNFDFLTDNENVLTGLCSPETNTQYTDLDSQQGSLCDDYQIMSVQSKQGIVSEEAKRLEEAAIYMMDTIYKDCNNLKVPYDPMMWTSDQVRKWVASVCQMNGVPDVSAYLSNCDGATLCSMTPEIFYFLCGDAGVKLSNELELWKAANTCFPNQSYMTSSNEQSISQTQPLLSGNFQNCNLAKCVSPALSSCSSNHDSNTSSPSTHSDPSDDESASGFRMPHSTTLERFREDNGYSKILNRIPAGRGHKQTIHLWQFLKELLLSKDINYTDCIRWLDRKTGVFKIEDSKKVATLWGARKNRPAMNYDKLSRSVRQYYKKGIIKKTEQSKRLVYQFCPGYL
ncbi:hypothetical protein BsWGS_07931 [Bradybaena similaris]